MASPWEFYQKPPDTQPAGPWSQFVDNPGPSGADKGQAALEGFGNAATGQNLPRIQALVQSKTPDPNADVNAQLAAKGTKIIEPGFNDYVTARDQNIARNEGQAREMPAQYYGGQAAGILAQAMVPVAVAGRLGLAAEGAGGAESAMNAIRQYAPPAAKVFETSKFGQALSAAKGIGSKALSMAKSVGTPIAATSAAGAAEGFLQNPGDTEGEESGSQLDARFQNAKHGAFYGAVGGAGAQALKGASKALEAAPRAAPTMAQMVAAHPKMAHLIEMASPENLGGVTGLLEGMYHGRGIQESIEHGLMGYAAGHVGPKLLNKGAQLGGWVGRFGSAVTAPFANNPAGLGLAIEGADRARRK